MNPSRVNFDALVLPLFDVGELSHMLARMRPPANALDALAAMRPPANALAALAATLVNVTKTSAAMGRALRVTGDARKRLPKDSCGRGFLCCLIRRALRRHDSPTRDASRTRRRFTTPKPHGRRDQRPARDTYERAVGRVRQPRAPGFGSAQYMTRINPRGSP